MKSGKEQVVDDHPTHMLFHRIERDGRVLTLSPPLEMPICRTYFDCMDDRYYIPIDGDDYGYGLATGVNLEELRRESEDELFRQWTEGPEDWIAHWWPEVAKRIV